MILAHAPSGYILATLLMKKLSSAPVTTKAVLAAGVLGGLAPDFDMLYFHLVDNRMTHHHKYLSHWPIIWLTLAAAATVWSGLAKNSRAAALSWVFCLGGVLHLLLDSFVGDVWWLAPFVDQPYALFTVPARFKPWWLNFILHWSFAVELLICFWAIHLHRRRRASTRAPS